MRSVNFEKEKKVEQLSFFFKSSKQFDRPKQKYKTENPTFKIPQSSPYYIFQNTPM